MLTPKTINHFLQEMNEKHTKRNYGFYPPYKKIMNYIAKQINEINQKDLDDVEKVTLMTNLLEGFIRYAKNYHPLLLLEVEKVLTYIYYPEDETTTLNNDHNLLLGSKGSTVMLWHDAYYENNSAPIINIFFNCKGVIYHKNRHEHLKEKGKGMPTQMQQHYAEMFNNDIHKAQKKKI